MQSHDRRAGPAVPHQRSADEAIEVSQSGAAAVETNSGDAPPASTSRAIPKPPHERDFFKTLAASIKDRHRQAREEACRHAKIPGVLPTQPAARGSTNQRSPITNCSPCLADKFLQRPGPATLFAAYSASTSHVAKLSLAGERGRMLAENMAAQRFRSHAAASKPVVPVKKPEKLASFAKLRFVLQERELLEASLARGRPQRAPGGAKKLQSFSYPPATFVVDHSSIRDATSTISLMGESVFIKGRPSSKWQMII